MYGRVKSECVMPEMGLRIEDKFLECKWDKSAEISVATLTFTSCSRGLRPAVN